MANITVLALDPQTGDLCFDANGILDLPGGNVIFDGGLGVCPLVIQPFGQMLEGSANIGNFHGLLLYHS